MSFFLEEDASFMNVLSGYQEVEGLHHLRQQNDTSMTLLGADFTPNEHSVVCGRAKHFALAPGNQRLKMLVEFYLKPYSQASTKSKKSAIVSKIVDTIKAKSPEGGFIKYEEGLWWEVDAGFAREKVGCLLRDRLHSQYRSSSKAKMARRQKQKATNNTCPSTSKTETNGASEDSLACNNNRQFVSDSVPSNIRMSALQQQDDVSKTTTGCSPFELYHASQPQNSRDHSNNYLRMRSIPSSLVMAPKTLVHMDKTPAGAEATGDWVSLLDRALFAAGASQDSTTDDLNIFNPPLFVDDIPITWNDVPISVDDIDNIFDD